MPTITLDELHDVQMFAFSEEQQATLVDAFPVEPFEIPADTYPSMASSHASVVASTPSWSWS